MAMSAAERKRRQREREKERLQRQPEVTQAFLRRPFSQFVEADFDNWQAFVLYPIDWAGFEMPDFSEDTDPHFDPSYDEENRASIGRAERMTEMLFTAAQNLAVFINRYKKEEIDARIAELQAADLTDPAAKKKALDDIVRLAEIRRLLDREQRLSYPTYRLKEEPK